MQNILKKKIEDWLDEALETNTFEDVLEQFDVTPLEAFVILFESGMIDEEILEQYFDV